MLVSLDIGPGFAVALTSVQHRGVIKVIDGNLFYYSSENEYEKDTSIKTILFKDSLGEMEEWITETQENPSEILLAGYLFSAIVPEGSTIKLIIQGPLNECRDQDLRDNLLNTFTKMREGTFIITYRDKPQRELQFNIQDIAVVSRGLSGLFNKKIYESIDSNTSAAIVHVGYNSTDYIAVNQVVDWTVSDTINTGIENYLRLKVEGKHRESEKILPALARNIEYELNKVWENKTFDALFLSGFEIQALTAHMNLQSIAKEIVGIEVWDSLEGALNGLKLSLVTRH
ncbi:hypothetical protein [Desulforamulus aquiferis]|uniref:Actin-like protein N-terminal domain-containing protein n=1 Tax=Desulforamulus aquiferis TaxID=1397668 RepID=A0AAW7Z8T9_9FIRM|nr:hypothetical protein [Desulforamulus aquiferis]MDO7785817.1 hypothetical protein [Desulforamulus aquiferis]